jgi:hypothetical protein
MDKQTISFQDRLDWAAGPPPEDDTCDIYINGLLILSNITQEEWNAAVRATAKDFAKGYRNPLVLATSSPGFTITEISEVTLEMWEKLERLDLRENNLYSEMVSLPRGSTIIDAYFPHSSSILDTQEENDD